MDSKIATTSNCPICLRTINIEDDEFCGFHLQPENGSIAGVLPVCKRCMPHRIVHFGVPPHIRYRFEDEVFRTALRLMICRNSDAKLPAARRPLNPTRPCNLLARMLFFAARILRRVANIVD